MIKVGEESGSLGPMLFKIADVFDQYVTYRPDWVARFEEPGVASFPGFDGPDAAWQTLIRRWRDSS